MSNVCKDCNNTFVPYNYTEVNSGPYVYFNFRGEVRYIRRDLIELVPYLKKLIESPMKNSPRDEKGYLMIDEQSGIFFHVVDIYRQWLEEGELDCINDTYISKRYLCVSVANRMGFDLKFVNALKERKYKTFTEDDLYPCYYCHKIFARNEKDAMKECRYHSINCKCKDRFYNPCCRLPYHSEEPIGIAEEPKPIKN